MSQSPQSQGARFRNTKMRKARQILQGLTPWSAGLSVTECDYVSAESGNAAFIAGSTGVTGATSPTGQVTSDGVIVWTRADIASLLQFLYTGAPTP
jgi:hypothetical protein